MKKRINIDLLGIFIVEEATAEKLYEGFMDYMKNIGLKLTHLLSIGTDGANNLCDKNKSLFAYLKRGNPNLILIKCTCHSIHFCCSIASKKIPGGVEFVVQELYNYFSQSSLRNVKYKWTFELINTDVDSIEYRKLVQLSNTRWLAYGSAVNCVLEQWIELKYHFSIIATKENERQAKNIYSEMCDDRNRLFPIINDMNRLNLDFQSDTVDAGSLYDEIHI